MKILLVRSSNGKSFCLQGEHPFTQAANKFLFALEMRMLSKHTIRAYGYDLLACFKWLESTQKTLDNLTFADLIDLIRFQKECKLAPRSINRCLITVQAFFRFVTGNELPSGPGALPPSAYYRGRGRDRYLGLQKMESPNQLQMCVKVPNLLIQPLSIEQVRSLLAQFTRYRDCALFYLMLLCGLRSGEVLSATKYDLCFQDSALRVKGKGNKERILPLPKTITTTIEKYLSLERPTTCKTDALFVVLQGNKRGEPMTSAGLRSLFRHRRQRPMLHSANPHRLRHTFGVTMARQGMSLPVLQRLMGHVHAVTTLKYINLSMLDLAEDFQKAVDNIEKQYKPL